MFIEFSHVRVIIIGTPLMFNLGIKLYLCVENLNDFNFYKFKC